MLLAYLLSYHVSALKYGLYSINAIQVYVVVLNVATPKGETKREKSSRVFFREKLSNFFFKLSLKSRFKNDFRLYDDDPIADYFNAA
jgi:hypothetical protein